MTGDRHHAPGHRIYCSAGPNNTFVDMCAVPGCDWRDGIATVLEAVAVEDERHKTEAACEAEGHAYFRDGADAIHGVCGMCACGSRLYELDGREIDG